MSSYSGSSSSANRQREGEASFGELVRDATESISTLIRSEIELAKVEVAGSVKRALMSSVVIAVAAVLLLLALPFLFVAIAEGLVTAGLVRWLAYLIIAALFVLIAAVMAAVGLSKVKRIGKPERTITTVKETAQVLRRANA